MPIGRSIGDERVGIVGLGNIGLAIGRRIEPFGCDIAWWGPNPKPESPWPRHASVEDLARWCTTLIVSVAGTPATAGLIGTSTIDAVGADGLIVNVSRGFVVEEPAMIAALKDGRLGGAALDVFYDEPIAGSRWAGVPNVIMAPHLAGATDAALRRVTQSALANIRAFHAGEPLKQRVV
jgi:lactate dehydrogenase-like 2-hydroxyacid dehydrogenase